MNDSDVFPALPELMGNGGREADRNNRDLGGRFLLGGGGELRLPWAPIKEKVHEGFQRKLSFMEKEFNTCQWRYEKALRKWRDLNQKEEEPQDPHENYWEQQVREWRAAQIKAKVGGWAAENEELFLQESGARWEGPGRGPGFMEPEAAFNFEDSL